MAKNITRVKWEASGLPFGVSFDERDGTFSGAPEDVGTHVVPVKVTTNYGSDTKDVFLRVEKRTHPLYVIGANAEVRSEGAEADSNGWRICKIPEGERIINLSEGFIVKTEAGTYVCGSVDISYEQAYKLQTNLNYYDVPTLKEEYVGLVHAVNGAAYAYNLKNDSILNRTTTYYFFWLDEEGMFRQHFTATEGYGPAWTGGHSIYFNQPYGDFYAQNNSLIFPEQTGAEFLYGADVLYMFTKMSISRYWLEWNQKNVSPDISIKKIIETFQGTPVLNAYNGQYSRLVLTEDGRLIIYSVGANERELETGIENIKNAWSNQTLAFIQDYNNNLYARGNLFGTTYSEFTNIGTFDIKKLLQTGNATVILTNDGKLYYAGQCASIPAMAEQTSNFIQIYPRYVFHDVHLESTDMAALIKYIN